MPYFDDEQWLSWIDSVAIEDYVVIDQFFKEDDYKLMKAFFIKMQAAQVFEKAGIGALQDNKIVDEIRGDYTYWLDRHRDKEVSFFFELGQEMISRFNRYCYLSLSDYEFHFAEYPEGSYYKRHLDQFKGRSNRLITFILYFNDSWQVGDGGELKIYKGKKAIEVVPLGNRAVFFKSADLYHEVLLAHKKRQSLTGWLLYSPKGLGAIIG